MTTSNNPNLTKKQLLKSIVLAAFIGGIVLFTAVLPAEYGIDPLGTGKLLGFSKLYPGNIAEQTIAPPVNKSYKKMTLESLGSEPGVPKPIEAENPPPEKQYDKRIDTISIKIAAGKGVEYKVNVLKHGSLNYAWQTTNDNLVFIDFHGEVKEEKPSKNVFYESYTVAYSNNMAGTFTAPFEGRHGWYFSNKKNSEDLTISLILDGQYELMKK